MTSAATTGQHQAVQREGQKEIRAPLLQRSLLPGQISPKLQPNKRKSSFDHQQLEQLIEKLLISCNHLSTNFRNRMNITQSVIQTICGDVNQKHRRVDGISDRVLEIDWFNFQNLNEFMTEHFRILRLSQVSLQKWKN
jgi:ribosomal protein S18